MGILSEKCECFCQVQAQDRSVASIVEMGFSADQANTALKKCGGNLEAAVNVLVGEQSFSSSNAHSARRSTDSRHSSSQPNRPQLLVNSERTERSGYETFSVANSLREQRYQ